MNYVALLGAGFSRNWGGWLASEVFEYLLGCPEVIENRRLQELLWRHQTKGGFENALSELQTEARRAGRSDDHALHSLQQAIQSMFNAMNSAFLSVRAGQLVNESGELDIHPAVRNFLIRFDAIFTLNQDTFLEHYYLPYSARTHTEKRKHAELPGVTHRRIPRPDRLGDSSWAEDEWIPCSASDFEVTSDCQPVFKLHGSSNWKASGGGDLLILGGAKAYEIKLHPILQRYHSEFEKSLQQPNTRLMVIGYGFRDEHINKVIEDAVNTHGLQMFVIDPTGSSLVDQFRQTPATAPIQVPLNPQHWFAKSLIGASRRSLHETFGSDVIERNKVMRFFEGGRPQ